MKTHLQSLLMAINEGQTFDYLYFWGHTPSLNGSINKSCFSQWYQRGFTHEGEYFATAEHWMMAAKARLFRDETTRTMILNTDSPKDAKSLGRQVSNFVAEQWTDAAFEIVKQGNYFKFSQQEDLRTFLLSTHPKVLVEASPYDPIWGIGLKEKDMEAADPRQWKGVNLLGFALMEVREELLK